MNHAILPPSSAEQWVNCPGWVQMVAFYPDDEDSEEARIGTAVHELCSGLILGGDRRPTASNGVIYNDEMIECAETYASFCLGLINKYPNAEYAVETHINIDYVHPENHGTPDFVLVDETAHVIHVVDYKHGMGVVEQYENWQLLDYLVGVMHTYGITEDTNPPEWSIHLTVVQPRAFADGGIIRTWGLASDQVRPYATRLKTAAHEALSPNAKCHAGDHCRYCSALHACPTAIQTGMLLFDIAGRATPIELSNSAIALQYEIVKSAQSLLKSIESSLEAQITAKIRSGINIPGWKLEGKVGNLKWDKPLEEVLLIGDLMGIELRKATEAITPTQARDKGLDTETLKDYASRPQTGFKLVKFDSQDASRIF